MNRKERRKKKKKIVLSFVLIVMFIVSSFYITLKLYEQNSFQDEKYEVKKLYLEEDNNENEIEEVVIEKYQYPKEYVEETYKGYNVIAKLEIPQIELETYVIKFSEETLNISVTKFWGPNPNESGNFCIAGHNFKNKNMFHNLQKLEIGDKIFLKDNNIGTVEYEIYNKYIVDPENVSCLSQDTNGSKEVTLITCTSNSKKRIIIKAREVLK